MSWLCYRPSPEIHTFSKLFIAPKFWQCIHPSLYRSRIKEPLVPTNIRSFYNFGAAERALSPEFTDFLSQFALVVVDKYQGSIADTTFRFRRILSLDILTHETRADKLDAQFNQSLTFPVWISLSGALAFQLLKRFPMKCPVVFTKFILQTQLSADPTFSLSLLTSFKKNLQPLKGVS